MDTQVHLAQDEGDILVFMPGQEDIEVTCETVSATKSVIGRRKQLFENGLKINLWFDDAKSISINVRSARRFATDKRASAKFTQLLM